MTALVWFRRDLRQDDHTALSRALATHDRVWCAFVFDKDILDPLLARDLRADRRVEFILRSVTELAAALGFVPSNLAELRLPVGMMGAQALFDAFLDRIDGYAATRDFPALEGTSALSPHFRSALW